MNTTPAYRAEFLKLCKARFRRRSTHVPNLIDELSPAKERRLNQFGAATLLSSTRSAALLDTGAAIDSYGALPMMYSYIRFDTLYAV